MARGREDVVAAAARALGFPLVGCVPITPLPLGDLLEQWLADGRAGEMRYLTARTDVRLDPRVQFPWARSFVCVGVPYRPPAPPRDDWRTHLRGRIAAYTVGPDYHRDVRRRLDRFAEALARLFPGTRYLSYVDTGAILEREWARRAGIGWIGKNTLVLHRHAGSYFFLGELVSDLEVDAMPLPRDHCGTCTRCVAACPTGALENGYTMEPRRCISYLTIEHRSAIPHELRPLLENWVFGCDVCQEVCPWNGDARDVAAAAWLAPALTELIALDADGFAARFGGTAITRTGRRGLVRNAAVALGNSGNPAAVPALAGAIRDADPLVRGHVAWALGRIGDAAARRVLDGVRRGEPSAEARAEIEAALGESSRQPA
ncbi:MAG TPA: tRNA epoxyqueuosine(34) reductase QueG [Candidatus Eisenbacteria bacterium]|nr:tRNA epoxyqueuosine(34) reductase QueG [Candidatus Eisenbacteria bacterium]